MCHCIIICQCDSQLDSHPTLPNPTGPRDGVAGLLGKTRPPVPTIGRDDANIFDVKNHFKTYAYTLSPKTVGIMANKSRDLQYKTLKRLHNEVLNQFKCSYIINIELYDDSENLHVHGLIRFLNHNQKEKCMKLLKDKLTMLRKGTYTNLIDCSFVTNFQSWADYIYKDQPYILSLNYMPFVHIDYSFHIAHDDAINHLLVNPATKTKMTPSKLLKTQLQIQKMEIKLLELKKSLEILEK